MIKQRDWNAELLEAFAPSVLANPWGFGTALEVLAGSEAFEYSHEGQRALIAVRPVQREHGTRLDVTGLVSTGERMRAPDVDAALLYLANGFGAKALAMSTLRPHLVAACKRTGWTEAGALMVKRLEIQ